MAGIASLIAFMSRPKLEVKFDFLGSRRPLADSIQEFGWGTQEVQCDLGVCSDNGPALVQRTQEFVFPADYRSIVSLAKTEATRSGFSQFEGNPGGAAFKRGDDELFISSGKYDPVSGQTDETARYVRVTVMTSRKEGWSGIAWRWIRSRLQL